MNFPDGINKTKLLMHIAFLTPEYVKEGRYDGGLANYLFKVGHQLAERGHQVSIFVSSNRNYSWKDGEISIVEFKRINLQPQKILGRINQLLPVISNLWTGRRFKKYVLRAHRQSPIDLIQASSYQSPGFMFRHNRICPMVCRVSSYTPQVRSAYGYKRDFGSYLLDWLEIRQTLDADAAFAPSDFVADTYAKIESFQPAVIRTPMQMEAISEDDAFYRQNFQGLKYLLFFGTLSRIKGVDLLAEVIPEILQKYPEVHFVFIGRDDGLPGGEKVYQSILDRCPGCQSNLHYHPAVPKPLLYPVIRHAAGVLMPSRADNYPNACLEALMCGVPVIGTENSSLEEIIQDGVNGFLARNGDTTSIQNAIEHLLNYSQNETTEMRKNIQAWIQKMMMEDRVKELEDFYLDVIREFKKK